MDMKDQAAFGWSLPQQGPDPIDVATIGQVAQRAETLGFRDLWVANSPLSGLDGETLLTYAAAHTSTVGLGVSVLVLPLYNPIHVAHQIATLDYLSRGRAVLGVGLGQMKQYAAFGVSMDRRVRRLLESVEIMKALWTKPSVTYRGQFYHLDNTAMGPKPIQKPHPPVWLGGRHPDALRRAAALADGWMGAGSSSAADFGKDVLLLRAALDARGRDQAEFTISKRMYLSVHKRPSVARAELRRWFGAVYHNQDLEKEVGVSGTAEQVREQLEAIVAMGATHVLLNPVDRYADQLEVLAETVGLSR